MYGEWDERVRLAKGLCVRSVGVVAVGLVFEGVNPVRETPLPLGTRPVLRGPDKLPVPGRLVEDGRVPRGTELFEVARGR